MGFLNDGARTVTGTEVSEIAAQELRKLLRLPPPMMAEFPIVNGPISRLLIRAWVTEMAHRELERLKKQKAINPGPRHSG
jgi:hypothetical protein